MALIRTRRIVDDAGASAVIAAAEEYANARGHRVVIAVVDPHGELIELRRTPGAQIASSRVAVDKVRTAAIGTSGETPDEDEAISIAGAAAEFSVTEVPALTYEGARVAAEAAGAVAAERGVAPVISAGDARGALMYLVRP